MDVAPYCVALDLVAAFARQLSMAASISAGVTHSSEAFYPPELFVVESTTTAHMSFSPSFLFAEIGTHPISLLRHATHPCPKKALRVNCKRLKLRKSWGRPG